MKTEETRLIRVKETTFEQVIAKYGKYGDTMDDIILKVLDAAKTDHE